MRRVLLSAGVMCLAGVVLFACEDESNVGPAEIVFPDAGLLDTSRPPQDARTGEDVSVDAPATTVTITVTGAAGPAAGVRVVFNDAAGAVLETKVTGVDGKATSAGAIPKTASVLLSNTRDYEIVTFTDIEAGDDLQVRQLAERTGGGRSYAVTFPALFAGATTYTARVGLCELNGLPPNVGPHTVAVSAGCLGAQNAMLVHAESRGRPLAYAFKKDLAAPPAGGQLPVTVGAFAAPADQVVGMTNAPNLQEVRARLYEIANGASFENSSADYLIDGAATFRVATGFADAMQAEVVWSPDYDTTLLVGRRITGAVPANAFTFDAATALPPIDAVDVDGTGAHLKLSWTSAAPLTASDGGFVRVPFFRDGQLGTRRWSFVVPPGAQNVTAPSMPAEAADWLPATEAGANFGMPAIYFAESDLLPNYAAFRRIQGVVMGQDVFNNQAVLPQDGTLKLTMFSPNPR